MKTDETFEVIATRLLTSSDYEEIDEVQGDIENLVELHKHLESKLVKAVKALEYINREYRTCDEYQDLEVEKKELEHRILRFKQFVFQQRLAGQFNQYLYDLEEKAEKFSEKGEEE